MKKLAKLSYGDKVAILSPSFAAPAVFPAVFELGLERVREVFGLKLVIYKTTCRIDASVEDKMADLISAFSDPEVKAVITTIGGDIQVTYVKKLSKEPFISNPKPFFGFSDNSHLANFLFLCGIPSFYGGSLFTQFAHNVAMNEYSKEYIKHALFDNGEVELRPAQTYNDVGLDWGDATLLDTHLAYERNTGWYWNGTCPATGILWGGCVESVDEMLRHGIAIPPLERFNDIVLMMETSEEIPSPDYVMRVFRALGERGILSRVQGICIGRPQAYSFDYPQSPEEKEAYRNTQRTVLRDIIRRYNKDIPIVQNMDFGHTKPQIPMPYGNRIRILPDVKKIFATF